MWPKPGLRAVLSCPFRAQRFQKVRAGWGLFFHRGKLGLGEENGGNFLALLSLTQGNPPVDFFLFWPFSFLSSDSSIQSPLFHGWWCPVVRCLLTYLPSPQHRSCPWSLSSSEGHRPPGMYGGPRSGFRSGTEGHGWSPPLRWGDLPALTHLELAPLCPLPEWAWVYLGPGPRNYPLVQVKEH